jgi:hypothetical protein
VRRSLPALLCGLAALLTSCNKSSTSPGGRVDPALASLIPADTAVMVGAKLDKLRDTATYQRHFSQISLPKLDDFAKDTGLDPRKDVWEVLFCSNGRDAGVLMLRGKFSARELEPRLEREGATKTNYKGYSLFGDERNAVFFMNSSTAVAGSTPVLKTIIDNRDRSAGGVPAALKPLVEAAPANAQVWAVFDAANITLPFAGAGPLGNMDQILRSIQNGLFSADLSKGFDFQAAGSCTDDKSAKQIHDLLKGLIGIGRLSTSDKQPEMLKVYDAIKVAQQGSKVNISADVPQDFVDKFIDTFVARRKG